MSDKKTFDEFILEYTDAQLRQGGTSAQRAIAQTRQRKREEEQRQKERDQKRLGSALAKRDTSTALAKADKAGKMVKASSSALAKQVKKSSALAKTKGYKTPMATQPDEKQVGQRPYSYNRGVTTLPDNDVQKKKRKPFKWKKHAKRALDVAQGAGKLAGKALRSGGVEGAGEVGDRDLEGIQTRSSLAKVN